MQIDSLLFLSMLTVWATVSSEVVLIEAPFSIPDSVTEKVAAVSGASLAPSHLSLPLLSLSNRSQIC